MNSHRFCHSREKLFLTSPVVSNKHRNYMCIDFKTVNKVMVIMSSAQWDNVLNIGCVTMASNNVPANCSFICATFH
jgi:hypothetical protein